MVAHKTVNLVAQVRALIETFMKHQVTKEEMAVPLCSSMAEYVTVDHEMQVQVLTERYREYEVAAIPDRLERSDLSANLSIPISPVVQWSNILPFEM